MEEIHTRLHTALIAASLAHKKRCRQEFQRLNLSDGQPKILSILNQKEGYLQKELALRCHIEQATLTTILANMTNKGLIYKDVRHVSGGKRAFAVFLTDKGRLLANQVTTIVDDMEQLSFQGFTDEEKNLLISLLSRLEINLNE